MNADITVSSSTFEFVTTEEFKTHILPLKQKLYRFAYGYLQREEEARDVVQEVMIKSWNNIKEIHTIRNIEAWCMTLTKNKSLDRLRKKGRNYVDIAEQTDLVSREKDPLEKTAQSESNSIIFSAISQLPENQKDVILLRDVEGYSNREIAEMLDLTENNVRILLYRGRQKLRSMLEPIYNPGSKAR